MVTFILSVVIGYLAHESYRHLKKRRAERLIYTHICLLSYVFVFLLTITIFGSFLFHGEGGPLDKDDILRYVCGFALGSLSSLFLHLRTFSVQHIVILLAIFLIGTGPQYWRHYVHTLGITKIGYVEFSDDLTFSTLLDDFVISDKTPESSDPMSRIVKLTRESMKWDHCYASKYGERYGDIANQSTSLTLTEQNAQLCVEGKYQNVIFEDNTDLANLQEVLDNTIVRVAGYYCHYNFDNDIPVTYVFLPFASNYRTLLTLEEEQVVEAVAQRLRTTLIVTFERLSELELTPEISEDGQCKPSLSDLSKLRVPDAEPLRKFVSASHRYPYAIIALVHLLERMGETDLGAEYLHEWILSNENTTSRQNLVRAHSVLDSLVRRMGTGKSKELEMEPDNVRLKYYNTLEALLDRISRRASTAPQLSQSIGRENVCKENPIDSFVATMLYLKIWTINNFVYHTVKGQNIIHYEKAREFTSILEECDTSDYITHIRPQPPEWLAYVDKASFLDTYALATVTFLDYELRNGILDTNDYDIREEMLREAIAAWSKAKEQLQHFTENYAAEAPKRFVSDAFSLLHSIEKNLDVAKRHLNGRT